MNVNQNSKGLRSASLVIILALLISPTLSVIKCDRSTLNNYGLSGADYSTNFKMETCTFIHDRCCSVADELKISSLWIKRSQPLLDRLTSAYIRQLEEIIESFWIVARLDPRGILLKQIINKQTPTKEQVCQVWKSEATDKEYSEFIRFYDSEYQLDRPYRVVKDREHFEGGRRHWNVYNNSTQTKYLKYHTILAQNHRAAYYQRLKNVVKETKDQMGKIPSSGLQRKFKRTKVTSDKLGDHLKSKHSISPTNKGVQKSPKDSHSGRKKKSALRKKKFNPLKKKFTSLKKKLTSSIKKSAPRKKSRSLGDRERVLSEVHSHIPLEDNSNKKAKSKKLLKETQTKSNTKSLHQKKHQQDKSNHKLKNQRKLAKKNHEAKLEKHPEGQTKRRNTHQKNSRSLFGNPISNLHKHVNKLKGLTKKKKKPSGEQSKKTGKANLKSKKKGDSKNETSAQTAGPQVQRPPSQTPTKQADCPADVNQNRSKSPLGSNLWSNLRSKSRFGFGSHLHSLDFSKAPQFKFLAGPPVPDTYVNLERPIITKFACRVGSSNFNKDYLLINQSKTKFCLNLYKNFLSFEFEEFKQMLYIIKNQMNKVHYLKKYFYCALCDAHAIKFIDHGKKVMKYEHEFCHMLIQEHMDYLKFMHVVMIKFADSMIQYIQCYESDAKVMVVPFQNFLLKYKRRMPFFEKCFKEVETESVGYFSSCWFICNKFSMVRVSSLFDGDVALLQRIKVALLSFTRKFKKMEREDLSRSMRRKMRRSRVSADLAILNNVDGLMVEPVAASLLITDKKFILNDKDRPKILGQYSINGFQKPTAQAEVAVDAFLTALGLGKIAEIRAMYDKHWKAKKAKHRKQNLAENYEGDIGALEKSPVNNLINQLYNITLAVDLKDHMLPRRELKERVTHILSDNGFGPVNGERHLSLSSNFTETLKFSPRKLHNKRSTKFESEDQIVGAKKKTQKSAGTTIMNDSKLSEIERAINAKQVKPGKKRTATSATNKENWSPENFNELYEKEHPRTDLYNYGTGFDAEGFNPIKSVNLINFHANLTALIGNQFKPNEKLERDVIIEYMTNQSKRINQFNEEIDETISPATEIEIRYKKLNRYQDLVDSGTARKRLALANEALNRQRTEIVNSRYQYNIEKAKEENEKQAKELQTMKAHAKLTKKATVVNNHIDHKKWNTNFGDIKELFKNLFGS
jgi:hypothetical protein